MKNVLIPVTVVVVLFAGYFLSRLKADQPQKGSSRLSAQETCANEAVLRHKQFQPNHWRALVLQPHN
jgi:hypothetical protein